MRTIIPHTDNPALREIAREIPLDQITSKHVRTLTADMKQLLAQEDHGVAIAAAQVGEPLQLFIVSGAAMEKKQRTKNKEQKDNDEEELQTTRAEDQVYINPILLKVSKGKKEKYEGCLSIKGMWGMVPRAEKATIRAYDEDGVLFTRGASGILAQIFQHEMDHLQGILYIDKAKKMYDDEEK